MTEAMQLVEEALALEPSRNERITLAAKLLGMNPYDLDYRVTNAIDTNED